MSELVNYGWGLKKFLSDGGGFLARLFTAGGGTGSTPSEPWHPWQANVYAGFCIFDPWRGVACRGSSEFNRLRREHEKVILVEGDVGMAVALELRWCGGDVMWGAG
jgi:hypothetical protein